MKKTHKIEQNEPSDKKENFGDSIIRRKTSIVSWARGDRDRKLSLRANLL